MSPRVGPEGPHRSTRLEECRRRMGSRAPAEAFCDVDYICCRVGSEGQRGHQRPSEPGPRRSTG
eukprot:7381726-Pyramimonas_sp.AAC.1